MRSLIEQDAIPQDVTISVLTQAREELIERTVESLVGARSATVHLYNATAPLFRAGGLPRWPARRPGVAVDGTRLVMEYADKTAGDTVFGYQYSPEIFTDTELDFALEVCESVWTSGSRSRAARSSSTCRPPSSAPPPRPRRPHRVDVAPPHPPRARLPVGLTRTTTAAPRWPPPNWLSWRAPTASRAACSARVSGPATSTWSPWGMNLFSQGVDPMIDFSQIDEIRRTAEYCNQMEVHPRHPYAGDLVYTSFSGSHQDAIKKGFEALEADAAEQGKPPREIEWAVPYLPIDPKDVGRSYEAVIRVNSQSGKGGVAYVLKNDHKLDLPRRMQIEFSKIVQSRPTPRAARSPPPRSGRCSATSTCPPPTTRGGRVELRSMQASTSSDGTDALTVEAVVDGVEAVLTGTGNGPISAFFDALAATGVDARLLDYQEHTLSEGASARAASYIECAIDGQVLWGIGIDPNTTRASIQAVVSAVNRAYRG